MRMLVIGKPRVVALLACIAVASSAAIFAAASSSADTAPADSGTPVTVSADALPTVQVDGVVWQQAIVGNTVYAVGNFATARPAGAAPGVGTVARKNILAYDITTGGLITTFAPSLNAQAYTIQPSADGSQLYIGGEFTAVNGTAVWRVAALNAATGALNTGFRPQMNGAVRDLAIDGATLYLGGSFTAVGSAARARLAAVTAPQGTLVEAWVPAAEGGRVNALVLSPSKDKVAVGGTFTSLNGSSNPGYGMGMVDAGTGATMPFAANANIRDGGPAAGITSLTSDGTNLYGSGFVYGTGGNFEGAFSVSWTDGSLKWMEDCHGDSYGIHASSSAVYVVGHAHYCGNVGGFPEASPPSYQRALAFSRTATGVVTKDPTGLNYANWAGNPAPSLLTWFPDLSDGTFTGQNQGPWTVTGNADYVVLGGEFPSVNNAPQQGLVRFAVKAKAPNVQGPRLSGAKFNPRIMSLTPGTVRITWQANWDRDNENLTYQVVRDGVTDSPIYTTTRPSTFWNRPVMSFIDTGLLPGSAHTYRLHVKDPLGNVSKAETLSVTVATSTGPGIYALHVLDDGADRYWRLGESGGHTTAQDLAGLSDEAMGTGIMPGATGAINGDPDTAFAFNGTPTGFASSQVPVAGPNTFTAEAWFKTTTTKGGKILGFGGSSTGNSSSFDRHIYMDNDGRILFGTNGPSVAVLNSTAAFNDGRWHYVAGELGPSGMKLFIDGTLVGQRSEVSYGEARYGYWRIGGDALDGWPSAPSSDYFEGTIDDVALYPAVLTPETLAVHYQLGSFGTLPPTAVVSSSQKDLTVSLDGSGSKDPDGTINGYTWDFGDASGGTGITATHTYAFPGTYTITLFVTDNRGAIGTATRQVTVTVPSRYGISGGSVPVISARFLDTRTSSGPVAAGGTVSFQAAGVGGVPDDASAVVMNLTVTDTKAAGFLTAYASNSAKPNASNVNYGPGQTVPNLAVVPLGPDGKVTIANTSPGTTQVIADVSAYFKGGTATAAGAFAAQAPSRFLDTRTSSGPVTAGGTVSFQLGGVGGIPANASAVLVNLTATETKAPGFLTACASGSAKPNASNVNYGPGQTVANLAVVPLGPDGKVTIANTSSGTAQVIADVSGYFLAGTPSGSGAFGGITPTRFLDTRASTPVQAGGFISLRAAGVNGVPANAAGVWVNLTVTGPTSFGYLTGYPSGSAMPNSSNVNYATGQTVPNLAYLPIGTDGNIIIANTESAIGSTVHIIADVSGYTLK